MEEAGWSRLQKDSAQELSTIRHRIDQIDRSIAALLAERLELAKGLKPLKTELNLPVQDPEREVEVCQKVSLAAADAETASAIQRIYQQIMEESRTVQSAELSQPDSATANAQSPLYFPRVLIVGLGLIGGALARQIKRRLPETTVLASDKPDVLKLALSQSVIDGGSGDPLDLLGRASLIILSASPETNLSILEKIAPHLNRRQIVIDVSSTKQPICSLAERLDLQGADFIGGHPFFGSEKSGFINSAAVNPEGRAICLVPVSRTSEISLKRVSRWLTVLGMQVEVSDAKTHDQIASRISHVVQLLAVALGNAVGEGRSEAELRKLLQLSGNSFRDVARLMSSPPDLWIDICRQNREAIAGSLQDLIAQLSELRAAVETADDQAIKEKFEKAAATHRLLS